MKDQAMPNSGDVITESLEHIEHNLPRKQAVDPEDIITNNESNNNSGFLNASNDSLNTAYETEAKPDIKSEDPSILSRYLKIPIKEEALTEEVVVKILNALKFKKDNMLSEERKKWALDYATEVFGHVLPKTLIEIISAFSFDGDTGIKMDIKPAWLDMDKFRRGQKIAADNLFGLFYSQLLTQLIFFSFDQGFKSILFTGNFKTPYDCFKRYLSTGSRFYNWYTQNVWTPGNPGYDDIRAVRRIHSLIRKKLEATSTEEFNSKIKIENPWCPTLDITRRDFQSTCPAPAPSQCPYLIYSTYPNIRSKPLNQSEMSATQFAFLSLLILKPKSFGMHHATEEDFKALCHLWRGLGYLLGIDDDFNFYRGSLDDIRDRSRDFIEFWVKPNFRDLKPEWEHVSRCVVESLQYYFPCSTYETCLCDLAEALNLHIPRLYNTLSYSAWIKHSLTRLYFNYGYKFPALRRYLNNQLVQTLERATKYDEKTNNELREKSEKKMNAVVIERQKCTSPMRECLQ